MITNFEPFRTDAMVHSQKSIREIVIVDKVGANDYRAVYNGLVCTAIFNPFSGLFYVDDIYGVVGKAEEVNVNA